MMSLENTINNELRNFLKTDAGKRLANSQSKTGKSTVSYFKYANYLGTRMSALLREEMVNIKSKTTGEAFLGHIVIDEPIFIKNVGWELNISFNHPLLHRQSLYPDKYPNGVDLAYLFNNGYSASKYLYGIDRHGHNVVSSISREANNFIERSVMRFNVEMNGKAIAKYSSNYTRGTY